jgi:hypothetical protein
MRLLLILGKLVVHTTSRQANVPFSFVPMSVNFICLSIVSSLVSALLCRVLPSLSLSCLKARQGKARQDIPFLVLSWLSLVLLYLVLLVVVVLSCLVFVFYFVLFMSVSMCLSFSLSLSNSFCNYLTAVTVVFACL